MFFKQNAIYILVIMADKRKTSTYEYTVGSLHDVFLFKNVLYFL
jgi:hypothetical protein